MQMSPAINFPEIRLAVLMTCHNRIDTTLLSVKKLNERKFANVQSHLFLVDDGSSDGTGKAVSQAYPDTTVIFGDGNLYWCGGTRLAFEKALQNDYDFYLWLNDDTVLYPDAIEKLISTYFDIANKQSNALMVVGSTRAPDTGDFSYGGWRQCPGKLGTRSWKKIPPDVDQAIPCDTINGNCVLISREVVRCIGILDQTFTHSMGDLDYGLRAKQNGCQIVIAPGYFGECKANEGKGLWTDISLPAWTRWKKLLGPKGLPILEWAVFCRRHTGVLWPMVWMSPYIKFWVRIALKAERKAA